MGLDLLQLNLGFRYYLEEWVPHRNHALAPPGSRNGFGKKRLSNHILSLSHIYTHTKHKKWSG